MLALQHLPATIVTVVAMLEPVIANALGWAWFRESLTPVQVLGAVAVLGGIVATIGDTVIDGTVRTRIDQLKSRL